MGVMDQACREVIAKSFFLFQGNWVRKERLRWTIIIIAWEDEKGNIYVDECLGLVIIDISITYAAIFLGELCE